MRSLKLLLAAALVSALGLCIAAPASAQVTARVVSACGSPTYVAGTNNYQTIDTSGYLCGKMTATITGTSDTNIVQVGGVTLLRGAGATGTGSQRITVAQDTTTVAGSPSLPAGSAIVGKFGIDQTTPGTTNGVQATNLPATVSTGPGVTGASSPRETVAQDATTIAGAPPGTLAAPSASILTVQGVTTASAAINTASAATVQLVAISGSKLIYVTAVDFIASGTTNVTFEYGTGSLCGTGTTVLTGAYALTAQAGMSKGNGGSPFWIVPSGNALCMVNSAAIQVSGSVSYAQQ